MSPNVVASVLRGSAIAGVIIIGLLMCLAFTGEIGKGQIVWGLGLFIFIVMLDFIFGLLVPVRCDQEDCKGRMRRAWVEESFWHYRLTFECDCCGRAYNTNFSFGFGGPTDW